MEANHASVESCLLEGARKLRKLVELADVVTVRVESGGTKPKLERRKNAIFRPFCALLCMEEPRDLSA